MLLTVGSFSAGLTPEETDVSRQAYAGLLWSKQFYHYIIEDWLIGDPEMPAPPTDRLQGRNSEAEWRQLFNRDIVSMPDKWEYPWVGLAHYHFVDFVQHTLVFLKKERKRSLCSFG